MILNTLRITFIRNRKQGILANATIHGFEQAYSDGDDMFVLDNI